MLIIYPFISAFNIIHSYTHVINDLVKRIHRCSNVYNFSCCPGEDRWLSTLLIQQGYLVQYNAAADALTYAPETFHEFFNQRRRWVTSTMASLLDLLSSFKSTVAKNDNVSYLYMLYQFVMFVASILTPGTIMLMIAGSYNAVIGTDLLQSFLLAVTPVVFFLLVCFTTKPDTHVIVAQFLSAVYAIVMTLVLVGNIVNAAVGSLLGPNVLFILLLFVIFVTSAILHPQELFSLTPGLLYVIMVPTGFLLLTLYSLCNIHVISWGTREGVKKKTAEEVKREEREREERKTRNVAKGENRGVLHWLGLANFWKDVKTFILTVLDRRTGTNDLPTSEGSESESALLKLQQSIDTLNSNLQGSSTSPYQQVDLQSNRVRRSLKGEQTKSDVQNSTGKVFSKGLKVAKALDRVGEKAVRQTEAENPRWIYDRNILGGPVESLSAREMAFWRQIIHILLHPLEKNPARELEIGILLRRMRTNVTFAFVMCNFLFVLTIFQLQLLKEALADQFFIKVAREDFPEQTLELEPLNMSFMVLFGLVLLLQFTATLIHRFLTFLHIMSRTEIAGVKSEYNQLLELADQLQSINPSNLDNEFEIPEPDYDHEEDDFSDRKGGRYPPKCRLGVDADDASYRNTRDKIPRYKQRDLPPAPSDRPLYRRDLPPRNRFYNSRFLAPIRVNPDMLSRNFQHRLGHLRNHVLEHERLPQELGDVEVGVARPRVPGQGVSMSDVYRTVRGHGGLHRPPGYPISTGRYLPRQPRLGY